MEIEALSLREDHAAAMASAPSSQTSGEERSNAVMPCFSKRLECNWEGKALYTSVTQTTI